MKPNAINYLSLAKKAGRIEIGEESAGAAARACHARLLLVAKDAPDGALRRARNFVAGSGQQLAVVPFSKEELGAALGKSVVSLAAITDPALALANRTKRVRQRQLEEKAHQKNLQRGKRRRQPGGPAGHHKAGPGTPVAQSKRQAKPAVRKQAPGSGSAVRKHGKKSHGGAEL